MKYVIIGNVLFWFLFVLSGEAVTLIVGVLNFLGIVTVALINAAQNRRIAEQNRSIAQLSSNVDGKMDALLAANKRADIAESAVVTRAEIKKEQLDEANTETKPVEVVVVKPADVNIIKDDTKNEPVKVVVAEPADVNIIKDKTKEK